MEITLRGMTWNHPRGYDPLAACARVWRERTGVEILWDKRSLQDFETYPVEELARRYDLIIIDAYSSDAIPIHLATQEAMAVYKAKLAPQGVVTMHISNRHLELQSVVVGIAAANDLKAFVYTNDNEEEDEDNYIFGSDVVIAANEPEDIGPLNGAPTWVRTAPVPGLRTWTDDYSNIIGAFWRKRH